MRLARLVAVALAALAMTPSADAEDHRDRFTRHTFQASGGYELPYRLLAPAQLEPGKKYPLVLFLHGAGERGSDNDKQLVHGMNDFASDAIMEKYPAFVVAPQCPEGKKWVEVDWSADSHALPEEPSPAMAAVFGLLEELASTRPIDRQRIYATGLSMGGYGVWDAIARRPELFAAAVPICGGGDPATAGKFKEVPLWAFHGDQDTAVKPERSRAMIAAIKAAGGQPKYTEYAGVAHDSWTATYRDPALYEWLFAQRRKGE